MTFPKFLLLLISLIVFIQLVNGSFFNLGKVKTRDFFELQLKHTISVTNCPSATTTVWDRTGATGCLVSVDTIPNNVVVLYRCENGVLYLYNAYAKKTDGSGAPNFAAPVNTYIIDSYSYGSITLITTENIKLIYATGTCGTDYCTQTQVVNTCTSNLGTSDTGNNYMIYVSASAFTSVNLCKSVSDSVGSCCDYSLPSACGSTPPPSPTIYLSADDQINEFYINGVPYLTSISPADKLNDFKIVKTMTNAPITVGSVIALKLRNTGGFAGFKSRIVIGGSTYFSSPASMLGYFDARDKVSPPADYSNGATYKWYDTGYVTTNIKLASDNTLAWVNVVAREERCSASLNDINYFDVPALAGAGYIWPSEIPTGYSSYNAIYPVCRPLPTGVVYIRWTVA